MALPDPQRAGRRAGSPLGDAARRGANGPRPAKPGFDGLVLLCGKCLKRQGLGRREAGRSLRRAFKRDGLGRKLKVVETGCLGPCPKRMLALATPAALSRGQVLMLDPALPRQAVSEVLGGAVSRRGPRSGGRSDA